MTDHSAIAGDQQRSETERSDAYVDLRNDTFVREYLKVKHEFSDYRRSTIQALPSFVINSSPSLMAAMQLTGEVFMFKGSNNIFIDKKNLIAENVKNGGAAEVPWHKYLTEPPKNIFNELFMKGGYKGKASELLRPKFYVDSLRNIVDLESASKLDWAEELARSGAKARLVNRWQTRSTSLNLVGWGINLFLPEAKDNQAEIERMVDLGKNNLPAYIGARLGQAVDVSHWNENKPQMTGGLVTLGGMCTLLSGFRNVDKNPFTGVNSYRMNPAHSIAGIFTTIAGLSLLFSFNKEDSYRNFGTAMAGRMMFLPSSIANRFKVKEDGSMDPGRFWYTGGQATFQTQSIIGMLFGGAEKNADGTIVDQKAAKEAALREAKKHKEQAAATGHDVPKTTVATQDIKEHAIHDKAAVQAAV